MKRNNDDQVAVCRDWFGVDGRENRRKERNEKQMERNGGVLGAVRNNYEVNWYYVCCIRYNLSIGSVRISLSTVLVSN